MINSRTLTKQIFTKDLNNKVVDKKSVSIQYSVEDNFIKLYNAFFDKLFCIDINERNVLLALLSEMDYKCEVDVTVDDRERYADRIGIKLNTFDHYFYKLLKRDIIFKINKKSVLINPYFIAKGKWSQVVEQRDRLVKNTDDEYMLFDSLSEEERNIIINFRKESKKNRK